MIDITPASGPAAARNIAARAADGDVLVFVDADVVVSPGALARLMNLFDERPDLSAVFGAYDDHPADRGFVSQYRNLAHAFIHRSSGVDARTFWAGFGAVRRNAFLDVGGFDERFRRPSVEDIDLGYRLTAAGYRVRLDPALAAGHLKKWTLASVVVSDVRDRGIPWTQLIWRYGALNNDLNLRVKYRVSIVLAYLACAALAAAMFDPRAAAAVPLPLAAMMWLNAGYYRFFHRQRGAWFAVRVYGMHTLHHLSNGLSFACGTALFTAARVLHLQLPGALAIDPWPVPWPPSPSARSTDAMAHAATEPATDTLGDRAARAALWRLGGAALSAACELTVGVLLARLLTPGEFGLMALALVMSGLAKSLGDLGIGAAVVQHEAMTERYVRTAFTVSVLLGVVVAGVMAAAAPTGAVLMHDPRVTPLVRLLALGFPLCGAAVVASALLRRRLDFRRQFVIDAISYLVGYGAVAMPLALGGYGVWSLAWGALIQTGVGAVARLLTVRHALAPLIGRRELGSLFRFGFGAHISGCLNYAALNGDNFVVGRAMGAVSLGLYSRAYSLMNVPFALGASVMSSVLFPALAQVQGDGARARRGYLLTTRLVAMIAAPAMVTTAIAAPHLVQAIYGAAWSGTVLPLQILCAAGYFRALYHLGGAVSQSVGRVYSELWRQAIYAALVIGGALVGSRYGLAGVATGVSLAILYMFLASGDLALQITETTWRSYFGVQLDALKTAAVTGGAALSMRLLLEASDASSPAIALGVAGAAAVPWTAGLLRTLGEPGFGPLRARLPRRAAELIAIVCGRRVEQGAM